MAMLILYIYIYTYRKTIYIYVFIFSPYPVLLMRYIWLHVKLMDGFEGKSKNMRDPPKKHFT